MKKEVDFKVHAHGKFAFNPLRYVDGCVCHVVCYSTHNGTFTRALDRVMKDIEGDKWALFYCKPNLSLENGLTLLHTDNDVRRFFFSRCRPWFYKPVYRAQTTAIVKVLFQKHALARGGRWPSLLLCDSVQKKDDY